MVLGLSIQKSDHCGPYGLVFLIYLRFYYASLQTLFLQNYGSVEVNLTGMFFFSQIKETLQSESSIEWNGTLWEVNFVIKLLVADLPAKASILNMQQFNAYFGCTLCLIKSKTIGEGKKGLYYPNQRNKMRTAAQHEAYIRLIQEQAMDSFRGVKGPSAVCTLIENLPLTIPVDYMHQVLLGVTRALLFLIRDMPTKSDLNKIRENSATLQLTSDFKRWARSLDELEFFKANELKVCLLYVGPAVFRSFVNESLYERFHLLSYSTRLLLFSSEHCRVAENLIERFHLLTAEAHSDKVFSANIHSLNHLAWQVRCFGPLWRTSAIMFESANYLLLCKFTGTVCQLKVLVDRYISNKNSCCAKILEKTRYTTCVCLLGRETLSNNGLFACMKSPLISKIFLLNFIPRKSFRILPLIPFLIRRVETPSFLLSVTARKNCVKFDCSLQSTNKILLLLCSTK